MPVIAAISTLALGICAIGAPGTALAASGGNGDGAAPRGTGAAETGEHRVTLITGDRVTVTDLADGTHTVEVDTAIPNAGVKTLEADGDLIVIPDAAAGYLAAGTLDRDLFNVSKLIEFGYDDDSVDATPVIIERKAGVSTFAPKPVPGMKVDAALPSIDGAAATATHADAAKTWAALTGKAVGIQTFDSAKQAAFAGDISAIHLDGKVEASLDSSVPWTGAPAAWAAGYDGDGVTVAVLDTGVDEAHPDLQGRVLPASKSFVPGEDVRHDANGHGTHVASTIAGTGAASGGTHRGMADETDLLVGKVLGDDGFGQDSWIIEAMEWAGANAPIVSMSLGTPTPSDGKDMLAESLNSISEKNDTLFIVAAGNYTSPGSIGSPGSAEKAFTVGSVDDPSGRLSWFSSQGPLFRSGAMKPDIAGPGSNITAARSSASEGSGDYITMSGTSMATPHVAGAAAIVKQQHPDYTAAQIRAVLASSASDVTLTSYQVGAGALDVAAAVKADVIAAGSGDFGMVAWGQEAKPVSRTIEYTNRSDAEVTITLDPRLADTTPGSGGAVPDAALQLDAQSLTIPAGETRSLTVTVDPRTIPGGHQLSGALVGTVDGVEVARTALGVIVEEERYDLTVTATGLDGKPTDAIGYLWDAKLRAYAPVAVPGQVTLRLPKSRYSLTSFMDVQSAPDAAGVAFVGDPDFTLDKDSTVAFDARAAKPVTVDVGEDGVAPLVRRIGFNALGFSGSVTTNVFIDDLYAQPMDAAEDAGFDFTTRWRLAAPVLAVQAGKTSLDVIPQIGAVQLDGEIAAKAVHAGTGTTEEFARAGAKGQVAVVTRSADIAPGQQAANAVAAGAKMLIVANDGQGELSEIFRMPDGKAAPIPVAGISGIQGTALLKEIAGRTVQVTAKGTPYTDEIWDIARYSAGSIPADQAFRPRDLVRIDTDYQGTKELIGEYRYELVPSTVYILGNKMYAERGTHRTEWVNAAEGLRWQQMAEVLDGSWDVRDARRSYKPGQRLSADYFGSVVRPYIGTGYWAPKMSPDGWLQINVSAFGDGGSEHTGGLFGGVRTISSELFVNGVSESRSSAQSIYGDAAPTGTSDVKLVTTTTHDGSVTSSGTSTRTEWGFRVTTGADGNIELPMLQASYNLDTGLDGLAGVGRKRGAAVPLTLEVGHLSGATGSANVEDATLEVRIDGGAWVPLTLKVESVGDGPGKGMEGLFASGRAYVTAYSTAVKAPDAGGWADLRLTAKDKAGNTLSQEIAHAFQIAKAK